jgi:hypothetical protein
VPTRARDELPRAGEKTLLISPRVYITNPHTAKHWLTGNRSPEFATDRCEESQNNINIARRSA